ncbi:uncharacterized protein LY89DRAFT_764561 [Mollisia scopiformis]|uniref:Tc1-like transposase DDE domain-containing protein n=1 Tax=Mollisia scopiformis TaxID=149040 RepID=A0A132B7Q8_MOLSC|nr:uncharacterized protein LY89DRAFT_764561 [Mollisia scopiformis]KUJ08436.1 hypothetical protein LY89DRAFT_764561 [Mollisia scopiformis]
MQALVVGLFYRLYKLSYFTTRSFSSSKIIQKSTAKGHSAAFTKEFFQAIGLSPIFGAANPLDLNPIETLWDELKHYIQNNYSKMHNSYPGLRRVVQEAWESIIYARIQDLIQEMGDRCIAVILADGGRTKD